ncbi:WXG100 family type VII secretion target [Anaerosporobacter sp.]
MATSQIEINTSLLDKDKTSMESELSKIKTDMKAMFDSIKELDTMWEGTAKSEFSIQFNKDYETLTEICTALNDFIGCMKYASTEYVSCENSVNDLIKAIKI